MTRLERLPEHIDVLASQISHLRAEMRSEFSAVRTEMAGQGARLGQKLAEQGATLRQEIAEQGATLRQEMTDLGAALRNEFRSDLRREFDGLATHMRVLHGEVIRRIALLHDASPRPPRRRRKT